MQMYEYSKALCEFARRRYHLRILKHIRCDPYTLKKSDFDELMLAEGPPVMIANDS